MITHTVVRLRFGCRSRRGSARSVCMRTSFRVERDSMGEIKVPADALWGAHTQRAVQNFPVSGLTLPRPFIGALGLVKQAAARVNRELKLLEPKVAQAVEEAAAEVAAGVHDEQFPIDVFQTGSGTSSNMNANEVVASLASRRLGSPVHPNDHVNMCQSSNDAIPTAIHVSAALTVRRELTPALEHLAEVLRAREREVAGIVKTGRTHLMDAMPVTLAQELSGWRTQIESGVARLKSVEPRLLALAQGGTAVGTGINAHPEFGRRFCQQLAVLTGVEFAPARNYFEALSAQDTAVELSGQLKVIAVSLMKIANDLRWMNSGPLAGLAEIALPALQPGSSIMPGKVNPVLAEALERNPILVTALNPVIGYEKGAAIAKKAYAEGRPIREVAAELTDLPREQLARLLDPAELTSGGIKGGSSGGG